jgi:alpha-1,3-rhamnosyltransferase
MSRNELGFRKMVPTTQQFALLYYSRPMPFAPLQHQFPPDTGEPRSVSVVVPSYNHAKFIERTLRSIFAQTLPPRELLVIDDGSKDNSVHIIERILNDAPFRTELITRENRGLSATLNEGLLRLSDSGLVTPDSRLPTSFFAYLGSDDIWLPDFLEKRVELLNTRPNAVLGYGNAYSINADDRIIDCSVDWAHYTDGDARPMLLEGTAPLSPTVVYRSAAIQDQKWNENSRLEDYEFYLRLSTKGEFAYDPEILSAWRQHGANTSEDSLMMMEEKISALERTSHLFELSDDDLTDLIRLARFRGAQELMRRGHKKQAMKFGIPNLTAAKSFNERIRFLTGLATPSSILRSRRRRSQDAAFQKYGDLLELPGTGT